MRSLRWSSATCLWPRPHTNLALFTSGMATGQSVRILWGPFANVVGRLERLDAAVRVRVLLDIMGTTVPVAVRRGTFLPPREKAIPASRLEAKPDVISTGFRSLCMGLFFPKIETRLGAGTAFRCSDQPSGASTDWCIESLKNGPDWAAHQHILVRQCYPLCINCIVLARTR